MVGEIARRYEAWRSFALHAACPARRCGKKDHQGQHVAGAGAKSEPSFHSQLGTRGANDAAMALASQEPSSPENLYESDRVAEPQLHDLQPPEPQPKHRVGDLVDEKYELLELLGQGGMSHVWRARDYVLNIDVALKIIQPRDAFPGALERLLCEARAAVSVSHPSIVRVLSFGLKGDDAYIAMELLEGETLEDVLLRDQVLAPVDAVSLLLPIARALQAAHRHGVIHRDVKPANILLARTDTGDIVPKLLDFGIARAQLPLPRRLTATGQVMGTPHYMSPEQASGRNDIDHRVDIWGLCAVLYETIAGIPPFDGENYNALIWAVLIRPLTPLWEVSNADPGLCHIVHRGLEKNPVARYASAGELAEAMEGWLSHPPISWPEGRPPTERRSSLHAIARTAIMSSPPVLEDPPLAAASSYAPPRPRRRWARGRLSTWMPTFGVASILIAASFAMDVGAHEPQGIVTGIGSTVRVISKHQRRATESRWSAEELQVPTAEPPGASEPPPSGDTDLRSKNNTSRASALPLPTAPEF